MNEEFENRMVHCPSLRTGEETGMSFASIIKNMYLVPVWYYRRFPVCLGVYI
jgi:hypothetical protein